jgi:ketosteroid isomerase-like protein
MRSHHVVAKVFLGLAAATGVALVGCHAGSNAGHEADAGAARRAGDTVRSGRRFDREAETNAVAQAIDGTIAWAKTKDFDRLYDIIADDSAYLEIHPEDQVVRGIAEFRSLERLWVSPDFRSIRHEIRDLRISFSRSGDVAWFFCMLDDINEWKGQPASWINTRWTGVLEKRDGRWRMVQMHFSNPIEG